jgi:hypothetical protein
MTGEQAFNSAGIDGNTLAPSWTQQIIEGTLDNLLSPRQAGSMTEIRNVQIVQIGRSAGRNTLAGVGYPDHAWGRRKDIGRSCPTFPHVTVTLCDTAGRSPTFSDIILSKNSPCPSHFY